MNKNITFHYVYNLAHNSIFFFFWLLQQYTAYIYIYIQTLHFMLWFLQYSQMMSSLIRVPCMYGNNNLAKLGESQCVCHTVRRLEDVSGQWQCEVSVPWYHMCTCTSFLMQGPELGASRGRPEHRCFS